MADDGGNWFSRLKRGLTRSSSKLADGIGAIFTKRRLGPEALEERDELLLPADRGLGPPAALTAQLARRRLGEALAGG